MPVSLQQLTGNFYLFCDKEYGFPAVLRSHMRVYEGNIKDKHTSFCLSRMQQGLQGLIWLEDSHVFS